MRIDFVFVVVVVVFAVGVVTDGEVRCVQVVGVEGFFCGTEGPSLDLLS